MRARSLVDSTSAYEGARIAGGRLAAEISLGERGRAAAAGPLGPAAEAEDQVKGRLLLDVVVGEGAAVLELFAGEDEALLVRGDALLVLDLLLHVIDRVGRLDVERDRLAREGLDEDLCGG